MFLSKNPQQLRIRCMKGRKWRNGGSFAVIECRKRQCEENIKVEVGVDDNGERRLMELRG